MPTLYDSYQLANSTNIPQYQGSTVGEMAKVSDILQQRYDAAELGLEALDTGVKNAKVFSKDQALFNERAKSYQEFLKQTTARPDLENVVKDVAKMGRQFGTEYKHFADNLGRVQAYQEELDKAVKDKHISKQTAQLKLNQALDGYGGMQFDPNTGRYEGQFQSTGYAREVDTAEWIKKVAGDVAASSNRTAVEKEGTLYFQTQEGKLEEIDYEKQLRPHIERAYALDPEIQSDFAQRADLNAWAASRNFEYLKEEEKAPYLEAEMRTGTPAAKLFEQEQRGKVGQALYDTLLDTGRKYAYRKTESSNTFSGETFEMARRKKKLEDEVDPLITSILQPTKILESGDPIDLDNAIGEKKKAHQQSYDDYVAWAKKNGVNKVNGRYIAANGEDVTFAHQKWVDALQQVRLAESGMQQLKDQAMQKAGFSITPALKRRANEAYEKAYQALDIGGGKTGISSADKERKAREAYYAVIHNTPGYKEYKRVLGELSKGQAMQIGLTTFASKSANEQALNGFKNLALNLDADGLEFGALGLQWGAGTNAGKNLTADDYSKIRDRAEFAGVGIDTDGQYKFFYKVGNIEGVGKKDGPDGAVIVKMPAMAGTAEALLAGKAPGEREIAMAEQVITQNLANVLSTPQGNGVLNFPTGQVRVTRIDATNRGKVGTSTDQIALSFQRGDGTWEQRTYNSRGEAVTSLVRTLSNHTPKR